MDTDSLIMVLIIGALAGWLAGKITEGHGFGVVINMVVGIVGAVIGGFLIIGFFDIVVQSYLPLPKEWYGQAIPNIKEIVFGALLIGVLLFRPLGILGDMRRDKLMRRVHGG